MAQLQLDGLAFSYVTGEPLFSSLSLQLDAGWLAVVGANGVGKSTLLRLIAGEIQPTSGHVFIVPDWAYVVRCRQDVEFLSDEIQSFADSQDKMSWRLKSKLQLQSDMLSRWDTLSPGMRKRWQLGAALAFAPEILLLDEPTNHIDQPTRAILLEVLKDFRGIGVVVSHDRDFLDELASQTLWLEQNGHHVLLTGNYTQAAAQKDALHDEALRRYELADDALKKAQRRAKQAEVTRQSLEQRRNASTRRRNVGDREAASMSAKIRYQRGAASLSQQASSVDATVARARDARQDARLDVSHRAPFHFEYEAPRQRTLLHLQRHDLPNWLQKRLAADVDCIVARDARIRIDGENGAGKTTLLHHLHVELSTGAAQTFYLPQELRLEEVGQLQHAIQDLDRQTRGRAFQLYARLGGDTHAIQRGDPFSPGEARKWMLVQALVEQKQLLLLDEPTNHLDLPTVEHLQKALNAYPGALILISHDDTFSDALTHKTWLVAVDEKASTD